MTRKKKLSNFYCVLTDEVHEGFRTYKFIYGSTEHLYSTQVIYEGILFDLGDSYSALRAMGAQLNELFEQWLHDNQTQLLAFENNKN